MLIYKLWPELIDLDRLTRFEFFVDVNLIVIVGLKCPNGSGIIGVDL